MMDDVEGVENEAENVMDETMEDYGATSEQDTSTALYEANNETLDEVVNQTMMETFIDVSIGIKIIILVLFMVHSFPIQYFLLFFVFFSFLLDDMFFLLFLIAFIFSLLCFCEFFLWSLLQYTFDSFIGKSWCLFFVDYAQVASYIPVSAKIFLNDLRPNYKRR